MRTIAVANQKGGCGKTTIAINLAACLAREGKRTLLIDLDPQSHCALGLSVPEDQIQHSIARVLLRTTGIDLDAVRWNISANFDLVPSKLDLAELEQKLAGAADRLERLREVLEGVRERYDLVVVDTPPNVGLLTGNALRAADEVLVPVDTGYFALHGLSKQLDSIEKVRRETGRALPLRIVANLYDVRTKLAREILAELRRRHRDEMLESFINFNTKLKESTSLGQPVTEYDPASSGCRDFTRLARELISVGAAREVRDAPAAPGILERAQDLAIKANALLATARPLFGANTARVGDLVAAAAPASAASVSAGPANAGAAGAPATAMADSPVRGVDHAAIRRRIDEVYGPHTAAGMVHFVVRVPGEHRVCVAGDFNGWSVDATQLRRVRDDGVYSVSLPLQPGRYGYRYVIDGSWWNDPHNPNMERNPFGEMNNVVVVTTGVASQAG